jgi:hypothetical protein
MKHSVMAALSAALIVTIGAGSAARAGTINFALFATPSGPITYTGSFLAVSTALDLDDAELLVSGVGAGDESGLIPFSSTVALSAATPPPSDIVYGSTLGPLLPADYITLSWSSGAFTEILKTVAAIDSDPEKAPDSIRVTLTGTVTGPLGSGFLDTPISFSIVASQPDGPGSTTFVTFNNATPAVPEISTWAMMAVGFGALGYAASRQRTTNISMLSA